MGPVAERLPSKGKRLRPVSAEPTSLGCSSLDWISVIRSTRTEAMALLVKMAVIPLVPNSRGVLEKSLKGVSWFPHPEPAFRKSRW